MLTPRDERRLSKVSLTTVSWFALPLHPVVHKAN
jgi:hypothetical protein